MEQVLLFDPDYRCVGEPRPPLVAKPFKSVFSWQSEETQARNLRTARLEYYRRLDRR